MKKKVFLSSTYLDLQPHRKQVAKVLMELGADTLGMEGFGARTAKPLETCIKEVLEADIYLGIIAVRYGSVDQTTGKSFTQLEYDAAYTAGKDILIYLIDDNQVVPRKFIDFPNHAKLEAFINILRERHTVDTFKKPHDLCGKLKVAIAPLLLGGYRERLRHENINCKVTRLEVSKKRWVIFVGFASGKPYEIFIGLSSDFYIPEYVTNGALLKRKVDRLGKESYDTDFCYEDSYGYVVTHRGLSRSFNKSTYAASQLLNKLLADNTSLDTILNIITYLELSSIRNKEAMRIGIIKALSETNVDFDDFLLTGIRKS